MSNNLDSIDIIKNLDKSGMYDKIYNFPEQIEEAAQIGRGLTIDKDYFKDVTNIVVIGMGGSAIGGDLVRSYLGENITIPFQVCRNYHLPSFVDSSSLVIASSYSGNTEETLSAFQTAIEKKAHIFCLTTGGKLGSLAEKYNFPVAKLPQGYQPRAALGFSVIPLLYFFSKIGLIENIDNDVNEVVAGLKMYRKQYSMETDTEKNPAKILSNKLANKIPIIYTGPELTDTIGTRWKGQICENSESLAFNNQFPEFNHNELVGWNKIEPYKDNLIVVYLRDTEDFAQISRRMSIVKEIIENLGIEVIDIYSQGDFKLGRMFSLIQIGDFVSFYLAVLNNVDPTPVKAIEQLKDKLSK